MAPAPHVSSRNPF